jgi:hypothetical protein
VNNEGFRYTHDSDFAVATCVPRSDLTKFQINVLQTIDYRLFVSEEEFGTYVQGFMNIAKLYSLGQSPIPEAEVAANGQTGQAQTER